MMGMQSTVYAQYSVDKANVLLAFGVRFDDRVTSKLETFARHTSIMHIDVDSTGTGKNKQAHISLVLMCTLHCRVINHLIKTR
eukprot:c40089_g1_i1 orf=354-602(+)